MHDTLNRILSQLQEASEEISPEGFETTLEQLHGARRVLLGGAGRSGLVAGMFAHRLNQVGLACWWVHDLSRPPMNNEDLFVACSGSGSTETTLALARRARQQNVPVLAVTGQPDSELTDIAKDLLLLPYQNATKTLSLKLPGQSLFEQCLFLTFEALTIELMELRDVSREDVRKRHPNVE